jgi:hypothetical protein
MSRAAANTTPASLEICGALSQPQGRSADFRYLVPLAALIGLSGAYILLGLYTLIFDTNLSYPVDLRLRWIEQGMIYRGVNPQEHTYPAHLLPENVLAQRFVRGSYPPWSYGTSMLLSPPGSWSAIRVYFAAVNMIALTAIASWSYAAARRRCGGRWGALAAAGGLAIFPICVCLSYGQYSIVVLALIAGSLVLLERGQMTAAGLALGLAAVKPQLAGLFFLVPAVYPFPLAQKLRLFAAAAAYMVVASLGVAWSVNGSALDMLRATASESAKFFHLSTNPLIVWAADSFGFSTGSKLLAVFVAAICAATLCVIRRQRDLLAAFSVCAILAFYWSYSRHYDLVLLTFPLVWLLTCWRTRRSAAAGAALAATLILLLAPIRISMARLPAVQLAFAAAAAAALATLVVMATSAAHSGETRRT